MTDPKIPAPTTVAWADDRAARGLVGAVESAEVRKNWQRTLPVCASRLTHPLITLAEAETYAAAREAAARTAERERLRGYFREALADTAHFREALADTGITWPGEMDILYDRCFSDDGRAG
jgi:hypothetical protein